MPRRAATHGTGGPSWSNLILFCIASLFEEFVGLPLPDLVTSLRNGLLKCVQPGVRFESPTKITSGGGVLNSRCAKRVEIGFVTPFEFEVFKAFSIRIVWLVLAENTLLLFWAS
ncbi:MAG: hypothetical protein WKF77_08640 [Planctomycetaceae bacterium]